MRRLCRGASGGFIYSFQQNTHFVAINFFPFRIVFEHISKGSSVGKQHGTDLVLVQNWLGLFQSQQVEVFLKNAGILENIDPAVNEKSLRLGHSVPGNRPTDKQFNMGPAGG